MLTIIDAGQSKVEQVTAMLYSNPGYGKTSLALTASRPLLLDFDQGAHRAENRDGKALVQVKQWEDVAGIDPGDLADYDTIVVDTVGTCLDWLSGAVMREDAKNRTKGGAMSLQGYGVLKVRFARWLRSLREAGKDIVLVAHMKEEQRGDETVERIVAAGGSREDVPRQCDLIGRILMREGSRVLTFDPEDAAFGKNCGIKKMPLPHPSGSPDTLATLLAQAKTNLNQAAQAGVEESKRLDQLRATWSAMNVDGLNQVIEAMKQVNAPAVEKKILMDVAASKGLEFDKKDKRFVDPTTGQESTDDVGF